MLAVRLPVLRCLGLGRGPRRVRAPAPCSSPVAPGVAKGAIHNLP